MSSIGSIGAGSANWATAAEERNARMKERLFAKADADGSGKVDGEELKTLLAKVAERSGQDLGDADELLAQMDSDGDGSLGSDELDAGMRSLLPQPGSTVEFAQRREGQGGPEGLRPPPPPDRAQAASEADSTELGEALSQLIKAVDSDGDSSISDSEMLRLGEALAKALEQGVAEQVAAAEAADGSEAPDTGTGTGQPANDAQRMTALIQRLLAHYQAAGSTESSETPGTGVDLSI